MIREVLGDFIALAVFMIGGSAVSVFILKLGTFPSKKSSKYFIDFLLGFGSCLFFILLTEIFFNGTVTAYSAFSYIVGFIGCMLFFKERTYSKKVRKNKRKMKKTCQKASLRKNRI